MEEDGNGVRSENRVAHDHGADVNDAENNERRAKRRTWTGKEAPLSRDVDRSLSEDEHDQKLTCQQPRIWQEARIPD